jgi:hypothetical protein
VAETAVEALEAALEAAETITPVPEAARLETEATAEEVLMCLLEVYL